jgi:polyphosphate kinase
MPDTTVIVLSAASDSSTESDASAGQASKPKSKVTAAAEVKAKSVAPKKGKPAHDLTSPEYFLNRELTWLQFNSRVLNEAGDERTPLLERVKFLAITGSNLDEFFMKRIGGLKHQLSAGVSDLTVDGMTPKEQLDRCHDYIGEYCDLQQKTFLQLHELLSEQSIQILHYSETTKKEQVALRQEYLKNIYPLVTPQSVDPAHPFPFVSNLSINLLVTFRRPRSRDVLMARVKIPVGDGAPRFVRLGDSYRFVPLEEVLAQNLDTLFPEVEVLSSELFRVTRNSNTEGDEGAAEDLLSLIESELRERRLAPIVRMEVLKGMAPLHRGFLAAELGLDSSSDVFEVDEMLGLRDLFEFTGLDFPTLKDPPHHPIDNPSLTTGRNIFHVLRDSKSLLLQHPYEAFGTSTERFVREAANDPKVRAIKMTLYRTTRDSNLIRHLIAAAHNGKQVAVAVELKARFDEEANIHLATMMEEAGIHVTYGVLGLKTHSKIILVVRQDFDGLRRYIHIGTGNYHPLTSRIYSDLGLLTTDPDIGEDATELFNYLTTGITPQRKYNKLLAAPSHLKSALLAKIERERENCLSGKPSKIQMKMNALEDADITRALYRASAAGVPVDLIVRDSCKLRPGLKGLSESVKVISIVGRFLEHARIYYFFNDGDEEYFIGSADAMKRNLEHRVEVVTPVESKRLQKRIREMLDIQLADLRSAWDMQPDGTYVQRLAKEGEDQRSSQEILIAMAEKRKKEANRLKKQKRDKVLRRRAGK